MIHRKFFRVVVGLCLFSLCAAPMFGQAVFSISSSPNTVADIGVAELAGQIALTITSGTSAAASFILQYSAAITNNSATEISVTGNGGLAGIALHPTLAGTNSIAINVPAGGTIGNSIRIQGVRVALAGTQYTNVTVNIGSPSGSGNSIAGGGSIITVVNAVVQPFAVDLSGTTPLSFSRGTITNATTSFVITEGYANAFTSTVVPAVGAFGQTVPTSIQLTPYPAIPVGLSVTFPATISANSGATLNTSSGVAETVPRSDGSTQVMYQFAAAPGSGTQVESFTMTATLTGSSSQSGVIGFQAELIPVGIAVPSSDYPSTDIPRYGARLVPDASLLPGLSGSVQLAFPFRIQSDATYTGIAITNPLNVSVNVTLTPYDTAGNTLANPKTLSLPPNNQISELATDAGLFGPNFNIGSSGTIVAAASTPILPGFYLLGDNNGSRLDGATADMNTLTNWVWPAVFHQAPSPFTTLELFNPGTSAANVTLKLFDSTGTQILQPVALSIPPSGSVTQSIQQIFPLLNLSLLSGGYVTGQSDTPVIARETFGNALDSNVLPGQATQTLSTFFWPHFASGAGYTTELTFINLYTTPNVPANLTITLFDTNGNQIAQAPLSVPQLGGQVIKSISSLFPALNPSNLTTGYVRVDVNTTFVGPFQFTPPVVGALRFSAANGSGSAALSLVTPAVSDFVYSHVAESAVYYTGIAMLNTNATAASVSIEVFTAAGTSVGTASLTLQPGQRVAQLLHQLMPATAGQSGGWIHITSDQPILSFSLFASYDGLSLSAIPPQNIGK